MLDCEVYDLVGSVSYVSFDLHVISYAVDDYDN